MAGGDRVPLSLKERDLRVIEAASQANERIVVALVGGSVFTMEEWKDEVPSILMAWYDVEAGGWKVEPMRYQVLVGPSSRQADLLEASFEVTAPTGV
jgi:hypothetical protein